MSIRLVEPMKSDASFILECENDPRYYDPLFFAGPYSMEDIESLIASFVIDNAEQKRYLVQKDDASIGIADLCEIDYDRKEAFATILVVEKERRNGYAVESLLMLEEKAHTLGIGRLFAWIRNENQISINLFTKAGYVKSTTQKELIVEGDEYIHVTLFEKCLSE